MHNNNDNWKHVLSRFLYGELKASNNLATTPHVLVWIDSTLQQIAQATNPTSIILTYSAISMDFHVGHIYIYVVDFHNGILRFRPPRFKCMLATVVNKHSRLVALSLIKDIAIVFLSIYQPTTQYTLLPTNMFSILCLLIQALVYHIMWLFIVQCWT